MGKRFKLTEPKGDYLVDSLGSNETLINIVDESDVIVDLLNTMDNKNRILGIKVHQLKNQDKSLVKVRYDTKKMFMDTVDESIKFYEDKKRETPTYQSTSSCHIGGCLESLRELRKKLENIKV